ncbi:hypothetical protein SAMN05216480_12324 [Pustulibacterium marinum]|uniref:Uncharacterized protein n=1 Tax=Pustulibacterium marinum TaxID=1224947 RepID=A0A1I7IW80_9FLAO|nr:hypothetical protein [Pustulibacterium marinum]SFU77159.1 hypothetical protein SAMN05216480_12324 [Pustulibacterium marinum]
MSQLEEHIQLLKEDKYHAVTIFDLESHKYVGTNVTGDMAVKKAGSVENYIKSLIDKGIANVEIFPRRKNGSVFKKSTKFQPFKVKFNSNGEAQEPTPEPMTNPTQSQAPTNPAQPAQNLGLQGMPGLGFAEITKLGNYDDLKAEKERLQRENERLQKENRDQDRQIMRYELGIEGKPGGLEAILTKIADSPELIEAFSGLIPKGSSVPALNGVQLSDVKQKFVQSLANYQDQTIQFLNIILSGFGQEAYETEMVELLKKHNLIKQ